ncbi:hypothetical protein [Cedecea sp. NFIX57]|uniref:hypothetical protein n=1 Tax=Cedecea sp. NFIX57 TaxID=1566286 RepID=UPI000A0E9914|nr:hypothetical protein [Cedecea sp. NFIX57]SMG37340.1 hypothetical protein SAMN03159353_1008172 [Cedecea sp. NFIX57]
MKNIKHWHVKLYQRTQNSILSMGTAVPERLLHEGYSSDKITLPHRDGHINFLTDPCGVEEKIVRADAVDSIVCTPVYEGDDEMDLNPPRAEMLEYVKTAIGEGYQPEHEAAVSDLTVIDGLNDGDLNREFGKCWQWHNMGGGYFAEEKAAVRQKSFETASRPLIQWLAENVHPHHSVIVTSTHAELLMGEIVLSTDEYLKD